MLKETLNKFLIINDVQAAIVIEVNGEIIESIKSGISMNRTFNRCSPPSCSIPGPRQHFGDAALSMVFVEFSDYFLILGPLMDEFFLAIIAKSTANIGQITYEMKKNQDVIVSLL